MRTSPVAGKSPRLGSVLALMLVISACASENEEQPSEAVPTPPEAPAPVTEEVESLEFCEGRPLLFFCEDFDTSALPGRFTAPTTTGDGVVALDANTASSGKQSALFTASPTGSAVLTQSFAVGPKIRLMTQVQMAERPTSPDARVSLASLTFTGPTALRMSAERTADDRWFLVVQNGAETERQEFATTAPVPDAEWLPVRFNIDTKSDGRITATLLVGADPVAGPVPFPLLPEHTAVELHLGVRPVTTSGTAPLSADEGRWALHYDTITFSIR